MFTVITAKLFHLSVLSRVFRCSWHMGFHWAAHTVPGSQDKKDKENEYLVYLSNTVPKKTCTSSRKTLFILFFCNVSVDVRLLCKLSIYTLGLQSQRLMDLTWNYLTPHHRGLMSKTHHQSVALIKPKTSLRIQCCFNYVLDILCHY